MIDYKDLAARGVRGQLTPQENELLRKPDALQHWYDALVLIKLGVETQFSSHSAKWAQTRFDFIEQEKRSNGLVVMHQEDCIIKKSSRCSCQPYTGTLDEAWLRFKVEQLTWKVRALKFLSAIEEHLSECKALRRELHKKQMKLREAIQVHRDTMDPDMATEEDETLWSYLGSGEATGTQSAV